MRPVSSDAHRNDAHQNVTTDTRRKMFGWIALAITAALVVAVIVRVDDWSRDWTENTASLDADADHPDLRPIHLSETPEQATDRIRRWAASDTAWDVVAVEPQQGQSARIRLTRTTRVFRFTDDIQVTIESDPESGGVILYATSQSRIGKGDLGQNPRNLIELTRGIRGS